MTNQFPCLMWSVIRKGTDGTRRKSIHDDVMAGVMVVIALCAPAMASQVPRASLDGIVADSMGQAVPGATVEVRDPATNRNWKTVTDAGGTFRFPDLPPRTYDVRVSLYGFTPYLRRDLALAIGAAVHLAIPLTPASIAEPLTMARNSLRLPAFASFDLRVLKAVPIQPHGKLDLVVEAFNVLNRENITQIDPVFGVLLTPRAGFGRAIDAANARHIQFSIDFEF